MLDQNRGEQMRQYAAEQATRTRLASIDIVRGLAMVIMALDHVREFVSDAPFDPTDMVNTTPGYFFTRWITHFCAPTFVFLAGVSVFLTSAKSGKGTGTLVSRGLWLMFLELAFVTPLGWAFNFHFSFVRLQVIWAIGGAMILLALAARVASPRTLLALGLVIVLGHDGLNAHAQMFGSLAPAWTAIDDFHIFKPWPGHVVASIYPILPWFGIMAAGYGMGSVFQLPPMRQRRILLVLGAALIGGFILLRAVQIYGDPKPWHMEASGVFTLLSFLNCTKYPPSLLYTLMTMGPALVMLGLADRLPAAVADRLSLLGRVPLFFYLLHLPLFHAMSVLVVWAMGNPVGWMFVDSITIGHTPLSASTGYGVGLGVVYAIWAVGFALLFPACRAYAKVKAAKRYRWITYL